MSDQPGTDAAKCSTYNKQKRRKSILFVKFGPAIPNIKRPHTYAIDCMATGIGS